MLRKLSKAVCIVCTVLFGLSFLSTQLGIYAVDPKIQFYLLAAAAIALAVFVLKTVTHLIFSILGLLIAAALIYYNLFMR